MLKDAEMMPIVNLMNHVSTRFVKIHVRSMVRAESTLCVNPLIMIVSVLVNTITPEIPKYSVKEFNLLRIVKMIHIVLWNIFVKMTTALVSSIFICLILFKIQLNVIYIFRRVSSFS